MIADKDDRLRSLDAQYLQLNEAYNNLRENYDILRAESQAAGAKQQLGVRDASGACCVLFMAQA